MYRDNTIVVVVPAYNEETQIAQVIEGIPEYVDHIVVVDDKSTDNTVAVVQLHQQRYQRLTLITHHINQGVGAAIASGYRWARDHDADVAVVMAGDGQMDPRDLPALLEPVVGGEVSYAKGNRLTSGEAYQTIPKVRYFGNAVLSLLTKVASGYWQMADSQSGYTAIDKRALHTIDWDTMYKGYGQPNDLLVRLNVYNFRVRDVAIRPIYNVGEKSGIKVSRVVFSIGALLVRLFFWRLKEKYIIRDFHPLVFFYGLSLFMSAVNVIFFLRLIVLWALIGHIPEMTFLVWLFSLSIGLLSAFFAMSFDMESNRNLSDPQVM